MRLGLNYSFYTFTHNVAREKNRENWEKMEVRRKIEEQVKKIKSKYDLRGEWRF